MRGATDMRLSAFAVTGYAAYELANQLGFVTQLAGIAATFRDWLKSLPPVVVVAVLAGIIFVVTALSIITSTLGNLVQFHGFQIVLHGDVLQRRYGLLTTRQKTLPRARIQRVTIEQTWLRRLLGFSVIKADSAGGSRTDGQDTSAGWDVVVPLTRATTAHALLPAVTEQSYFACMSMRRIAMNQSVFAYHALTLALSASVRSPNGFDAAGRIGFSSSTWATLAVRATSMAVVADIVLGAGDNGAVPCLHLGPVDLDALV